MDKNVMKMIAIVCLVICAICLYVAFERYQTNSDAVNAMKQFTNSMPMPGGMNGAIPLKAATPAATKYAILFAIISGVAGGVLLAKSGSSSSHS